MLKTRIESGCGLFIKILQYILYMVVESAVVFCHVVAAMLPPLMHMLLGAAAI